MSIRYIHYNKEITGGGNTFALEKFNGKFVVGISHCSEKDRFSKKIGRSIAINYLEAMKDEYNKNNVKLLTKGFNMNNRGKIVGFIIDDEIMFNLFMENFSNFSIIGDVISHIKLNVEEIDYYSIEGSDLRKMLIEYYNNLIDYYFYDNNKMYID